MTISKAAQAHLRAIYERNGKSLSPAVVLDAAKNEDSPLHKYFEWDDRKAAHLYRLTQAREIIGLCVLVESGAREYAYVPSRASFVAVSDAIKEAPVWNEVVAEIERSIQFAIASAERTIALGSKRKRASFQRFKKTTTQAVETLKRAYA